MILFSNPNRFRLWVYTVGHKTLILRGTGAKPGGRYPKTSLDIKFKGVEYAEVVPVYNGLVIEVPMEEMADLSSFPEQLRIPASSGVPLRLLSNGTSYWIRATYPYVEEHNYEPQEFDKAVGEEIKLPLVSNGDAPSQTLLD